MEIRIAIIKFFARKYVSLYNIEQIGGVNHEKNA